VGSLGDPCRGPTIDSDTFKGVPYKGTAREKSYLSRIANDLEQVVDASPQLAEEVDCLAHCIHQNTYIHTEYLYHDYVVFNVSVCA
jgi:hypothetical protein